MQVSFEKDWHRIETTELALLVYKFSKPPNLSTREGAHALCSNCTLVADLSASSYGLPNAYSASVCATLERRRTV